MLHEFFIAFSASPFQLSELLVNAGKWTLGLWRLDNVEFHNVENLYHDKLGHARLDPRKRSDHDEHIPDSLWLMDF